jgi:hypothetical protein
MTPLRTLALGKGTTSRRGLLRALGVSAAAAPFIPVLDGWAAPGGGARRLVLVFSPHGVVPENYWPAGNDTSFNFPAGSILEPMTPHKGEMVIFKGLARPSRGPGEHERCGGNLWTGTALAPGSQDANGPSIDQIVARALGTPTEFQSIQLGAQTSYWGENDVVAKLPSPNTSLIYGAARSRMTPELDPEKAFARLFAGRAGAPMTSAGDVARTRAEKQSIIDFVSEEIGLLQPRLAREDRAKIDGHLALVRDLERRLQAPAAMCGAVETPQGGIDLGKNESFPAIIKLMNKILVAALACDRTRVASMQYSRSFSNHRHTWVGSTQGHHQISHNAGAKGPLTAIQRWYMGHISDLVTAFKGVQEQGRPMLDNMLVVYGSECSTPWDHNAAPPPNIFIGRGGGAIPRPGRVVDFGGKHDHNQYLVTIAHAMGVTSVNKVGDLGMEGKLPGILD